MTNILRTPQSGPGSNGVVSDRSSGSEMLTEDLFTKQLGLERKRTERSGQRPVLMLLDLTNLLRGGSRDPLVTQAVSALRQCIRETDIKGWYAASVIGVIFTEIGDTEGPHVAKALLSRVTAALCRIFPIDEVNNIRIALYVYPEDWDDRSPRVQDGSPALAGLMHKTEGKTEGKRVSYGLPKSINVLGSLFALVVLSRLFLIAAAAIEVGRG